MPAIKENLKALRQAKGLTQEQVAQTISLTRQAISGYESGRTQPDLETLKRLAAVYQADIQDVHYRGNHLQGKLRKLKGSAVTLIAILLLGIVVRSALLWVANKHFSILPGSMVDAESRLMIDLRFSLLHRADAFFHICAALFGAGCIAMIYPSVVLGHAFTVRKLLWMLALMVAVVPACALPFALTDTTYATVNYLWPLWRGIIPAMLLFAAVFLAKLIKGRHSD